VSVFPAHPFIKGWEKFLKVFEKKPFYLKTETSLLFCVNNEQNEVLFVLREYYNLIQKKKLQFYVLSFAITRLFVLPIVCYSWFSFLLNGIMSVWMAVLFRTHTWSTKASIPNRCGLKCVCFRANMILDSYLSEI